MSNASVKQLKSGLKTAVDTRIATATTFAKRAFDGGHGVEGAIDVTRAFELDLNQWPKVIAEATGIGEFEAVMRIADWNNHN